MNRFTSLQWHENIHHVSLSCIFVFFISRVKVILFKRVILIKLETFWYIIEFTSIQIFSIKIKFTTVKFSFITIRYSKSFVFNRCPSTRKEETHARTKQKRKQEIYRLFLQTSVCEWDMPNEFMLLTWKNVKCVKNRRCFVEIVSTFSFIPCKFVVSTYLHYKVLNMVEVLKRNSHWKKCSYKTFVLIITRIRYHIFYIYVKNTLYFRGNCLLLSL